jgi:cyclin D2
MLFPRAPNCEGLEVEAVRDRVLLEDDRVMRNMLEAEARVQKIDYCATHQSEIKPHMRKIVADWMLEVCQDQQCQSQVFHLALHYMDLFLSRKNIPKNWFQAMAAGCLLLASKFSEVRPLTTEKLSLYTDSSVSAAELKEWELKILNVLQWELTAVTIQDFLDHFMPNASAKDQQMLRLRGHAELLAAAAVTEYKFLLVPPSLLAAACLAAACQGLTVEDNSNSSSLLPELLPPALLAQAGQICILMDHLDDLTVAVGQPSTSVSTICADKLPPFHTVAKTAGGSCYPQEATSYLQYLAMTTSAVGG